MKQLIFSVIILSLCSLGQADVKIEYINRQLAKKGRQFKAYQDIAPESFIVTTASGSFEQKLDHRDSSNLATFSQRYFINSSYATSLESPVIYYICGESACEGEQLGRGTLVHFAQNLKAHLVTLEHRYYGKSQPFSTLTSENLKYLTTEYALEDLAQFQHHAVTTIGLKGKWIAVGGSYAGSLAAYYRLKYPENVVGALASSAPVQARANFEAYDFHVGKVTGVQCSTRTRDTVKLIENELVDPVRAAAVKKAFGAQDVRDNVDFMYVVADIAAFAVQYGFTEKFCAAINVEDSIQGYANIGKELFGYFGMTPFMDSFQAAENLDPYAYQDFALRQWMYQSCTEYGYYQVAYHDAAVSTRSARIDLDYHNNVCNRLFGISVPVDYEKTNRKYYEPLLVPEVHNVFLTNGSDDPWTNLSITKENGNDTNPSLNLMTIAGGSHCSDLSNGSTVGAKLARAKFLELANVWLGN